ncbi:unnamed protein product [Rotaria magnacalcarata]
MDSTRGITVTTSVATTSDSTTGISITNVSIVTTTTTTVASINTNIQTGVNKTTTYNSNTNATTTAKTTTSNSTTTTLTTTVSSTTATNATHNSTTTAAGTRGNTTAIDKTTDSTTVPDTSTDSSNTPTDTTTTMATTDSTIVTTMSTTIMSTTDMSSTDVTALIFVFVPTATTDSSTAETVSISTATDSTDPLSRPREPLSLEALRMIIKAKLRRDHPNAIFPYLPTRNGNLASYLAFVRQHGSVIEGRYTLGGVPVSDYDYVTCVYYNHHNIEISRLQISTKPGFCDVTSTGIPDVRKLEMLVYGISSSPTGGYISLDGTYVPTRGVSNYGNIFGYRDSEICTSMRVSTFNMPNEQIKVDSATGTSTWSIVPKRLDSSSTVRLEKVLVESSNADIGITTIVPVLQQNNGQLVELNSISGQANSPIADFPTDDNIDIFFVSVTMFPSYPGRIVDPSQVSVTVDYCSLLGNSNESPNANNMYPYFLPNNMDSNNNNYNQQAPLPFRSSIQQQNLGQPFSGLSSSNIFQYISGSNNDANQVDPLSSASCRQSQSSTMTSSSSNVNAQGNIWQINIDQTYGLSVKVDTLRVNTEGQPITGIVLLVLIDANQQQIGPFVSQINDGSILTIQNLPSTSISTIHLQFPDGTESSGYSVDMVLCPQTTAASSKSRKQGYNSQSGQSMQQNSLLQPHQLKPNHHRYQMLPVSQIRQPSHVQQPGQVYQQGHSRKPAHSEQAGQQLAPWQSQQPALYNQHDQSLQSSYPGQAGQQLAPINQQGHSRKPPHLRQADQQRIPWQSPEPTSLNQQSQSWRSPYSGQSSQQLSPSQSQPLAPVNQQGHSRKPPHLGQVSQQRTPWLYPQPVPLNQLGQSWQSPYSRQAGQQQTPRQPNQTAKPGSPLGLYYPPKGAAPLPTPNLHRLHLHNPNNHKPKSTTTPNHHNSFSQNPNNQYGSSAPPHTPQNMDDEIPCTLYVVRPGSRRIVSNTTNAKRLGLILQVPSKSGYMSIPNSISVRKTPITRLSVNYLNTDRSPASMSNGSVLHFLAAPNVSDIPTFPDRVSAEMLQVNIDGAVTPPSPPSYEVHMIICYESTPQTQHQQATPQYQFPTQPNIWTTSMNHHPMQSGPYLQHLQNMQQQYQHPRIVATTSTTNTTTATTTAATKKTTTSHKNTTNTTRAINITNTMHSTSTVHNNHSMNSKNTAHIINTTKPHTVHANTTTKAHTVHINTTTEAHTTHTNNTTKAHTIHINTTTEAHTTHTNHTTKAHTTHTNNTTEAHTIHTTTTATTASCSCQCQCPQGAIQPQVQGATVQYQYIPAPHQHIGR